MAETPRTAVTVYSDGSLGTFVTIENEKNIEQKLNHPSFTGKGGLQVRMDKSTYDNCYSPDQNQTNLNVMKACLAAIPVDASPIYARSLNDKVSTLTNSIAASAAVSASEVLEL